MGMTLTNLAASAGLLLVLAIICGVFTAQGATVFTVMPSLGKSMDDAAAGFGDAKVEAAAPLASQMDGLFGRHLFGEIAGMAHGLRAEFLGEMRGGLSQSALVEIGKHEPGAVLCQPLGDRKT